MSSIKNVETPGTIGLFLLVVALFGFVKALFYGDHRDEDGSLCFFW